MIPFGPGLRAIIAINSTFLAAALLAALAWLIWPEAVTSWQLRFMSTVCGLGAFGLAVKGTGDIWRHVRRDIAVHRFHRQGRKPQSDQFASDSALRKSGIIK